MLGVGRALTEQLLQQGARHWAPCWAFPCSLATSSSFPGRRKIALLVVSLGFAVLGTCLAPARSLRSVQQMLVASSAAGSGGKKRKRQSTLPDAAAAEDTAIGDDVTEKKKTRIKKIKKKALTCQEERAMVCANGKFIHEGKHWTSFDDAAKYFPAEIMFAMKKAGLVKPAQIQGYTWPSVIKGRDVIGIAQSGSGKTLAYLLPLLTHIHKKIKPDQRKMGPSVLILVPSHELVNQVVREAKKYGSPCGLTTLGLPKRQNAKKGVEPPSLAGVHCVVATPDNLQLYFVNNELKLDNVRGVVVDEADLMFSKQFQEAIDYIFTKLIRKKQALFYSATWTNEVHAATERLLKSPYRVVLGLRDRRVKANPDISQQIHILDEERKVHRLLDVLDANGVAKDGFKALVFCATKMRVDWLVQGLNAGGLPSAAVQSSAEHKRRDAAMEKFTTGQAKVLVTTDILSRGIDIEGLNLVVNYDAADSATDHVHRIGRTGRFGRKGKAVTFLTASAEDAVKASGIIQVLEEMRLPVNDHLRELAASVNNTTPEPTAEEDAEMADKLWTFPADARFPELNSATADAI
eukprot:gnl/TRDRNA2_/TRDRNA2_163133_c0_seq1.p1 gnl/TRDRNA2_/TRDRNA2_163133_c0~~gnl/TRDRNA2_/TRDRNA2_163133_c0_seq1.p1  ORF type:complete len:577 (-),score=114.44 gnl/TRDRNA2_/TRDRNA2_163133_c0_seq1:86-1816(-)